MIQTSHEDDPGIPTLTRRAGAGGYAEDPQGPSAQPPWQQRRRPPESADARGATGFAEDPLLSNAVLQTLLVAEMERTVNRAIDEAMDGVRLRLEQEIPAIVERTLRRVRGHE